MSVKDCRFICFVFLVFFVSFCFCFFFFFCFVSKVCLNFVCLIYSCICVPFLFFVSFVFVFFCFFCFFFCSLCSVSLVRFLFCQFIDILFC